MQINKFLSYYVLSGWKEVERWLGILETSLPTHVCTFLVKPLN